MTTPGQRPGTEVEQEFVTTAVLLEDPPLPPILIGIAKQLEEDLDGGTYDARPSTGGANVAADFENFYPELKLNATVDLLTVTAKVQNALGVFDLDASYINVTPPVLPADKFRIEKDAEIERTLVSGGTTGSFAGTSLFTDLSGKFISAGVAPATGDITAVELRITSGSLSGNAYDITGVTSQNVLVTSYGGAVIEGNIQYDIVEVRKAWGTLLISYEATRSDLNDQLITITDDDSIASLVGPIDPRNELGFAVDKCRLNAGESKVYVCAVDADTVAEHTRALEFLESEDGYCLVPLSQDTAVLQLYEPHVVTSSLPENKRERIALLNRELLLRETKISTSDAHTGAFTNSLGEKEFDDTTGVVGFDYADYVVPGDFVIYDDGGVIRELLIQQILSPTKLLINEPGSVNWPGLVNLVSAGYTALSGVMSKTEQAEFIGAYAQSFAERRIVLIWPDEVEVSFNDTLILVPGYFFSAGVAGLVAGQKPQQPLTNLSVAGFTGLRHSNRYFNETQLKILSANGVFIGEQVVETASPYIRQQRTTDISSILKNELSVVKTVDFVSKLFRQELDPYTGKYNITPELIDTVKVVIEGLFSRLKQQTNIGPVILSGRLISVTQDDVALDTLNVVVDIEVPVPANFIRVRIQV